MIVYCPWYMVAFPPWVIRASFVLLMLIVDSFFWFDVEIGGGVVPPPYACSIVLFKACYCLYKSNACSYIYCSSLVTIQRINSNRLNLTFLSLCHLNRHFLFLSVFDQHVITAVCLGPNVTRLHISLSLFFMRHSIVYDLCTLIGCCYSRLFWLLFWLFLLNFFLLFFFSGLKVRFGIVFLYYFIW